MSARYLFGNCKNTVLEQNIFGVYRKSLLETFGLETWKQIVISVFGESVLLNFEKYIEVDQKFPKR